jgi:hypothetical protein
MARKRHKKKAAKKRGILIEMHPLAFPAGLLGMPGAMDLNKPDAWKECIGTPLKDFREFMQASKKYAIPIGRSDGTNPDTIRLE